MIQRIEWLVLQKKGGKSGNLFKRGLGKRSYVLPVHFDSNNITVQGINYPPFKLFHMSILFRASVSKLPTFSLVKRGPHEQELKEMLKSKTPGPPDKYPIFACAVMDRSKTVMHGLITNPK